MLIGGVVDDEFGDDPDAQDMRLPHEIAKIAHGSVRRMNAPIIGDVVAVVAQRRRIERQQPNTRRAEVLDVLEFLG